MCYAGDFGCSCWVNSVDQAGKVLRCQDKSQSAGIKREDQETDPADSKIYIVLHNRVACLL